MGNVKQLKFTRIRGVRPPVRSTPGSAGIDLFVPLDLNRIDMNKMAELTRTDIRIDTNTNTGYVTNIVLAPHQSVVIPTGLKVNVPEGYVLKIENKSSVATLKELVVGACIIDSDYTGEILINLHNISEKKMAVLCPNDKMCQAVLYPIETPELVEIATPVELFKDKETLRNGGGFGSTGGVSGVAQPPMAPTPNIPQQTNMDFGNCDPSCGPVA